MIRLGLCCQFREQPIKFRTTTAAALSRLSAAARAEKLAGICRDNAAALSQALEFCRRRGIGCFRVNSQILPLKTHPKFCYQLPELPGGAEIVEQFRACGRQAVEHDVRTSFHPDQFVVLNSPRADVFAKSIAELEYQAEVAEWIAADVLNIHAGGAYGDKPQALDRFAKNLDRLSARARQRLTVENDDRSYSPGDLLPLCRAEGVPLVYDVHHHRCLPDALSIEEATEQALTTWEREPMFHISSPLAGWGGEQPRRHHDYIDVRDFPRCWQSLSLTVEVEAKAKELAVLKLQRALRRRMRLS